MAIDYSYCNEEKVLLLKDRKRGITFEKQPIRLILNRERNNLRDPRWMRNNATINLLLKEMDPDDPMYLEVEELALLSM